MLGSLNIITVAPGTTIKHNDKDLTVTDAQAVQKGADLYVTETTFNAIKKRTSDSDKVGQSDKHFAVDNKTL